MCENESIIWCVLWWEPRMIEELRDSETLIWIWCYRSLNKIFEKFNFIGRNKMSALKRIDFFWELFPKTMWIVWGVEQTIVRIIFMIVLTFVRKGIYVVWRWSWTRFFRRRLILIYVSCSFLFWALCRFRFHHTDIWRSFLECWMQKHWSGCIFFGVFFHRHLLSLIKWSILREAYFR